LPQVGTIQKLKASPDGQDFTFTFSSLHSKDKSSYNNTLFSFNVLSNQSTPVYGFNHQTLRATDWTYSPDGTVLVVQTFSSVLEAVYLNGTTPPLPLGAYGIISGFSYDGADIYVGNLIKGLSVINVTSRAAKLLNQAPLGPTSNLLLVSPLLNSNGYVELVQKAVPGSANLAQYVILVQGTHTRTIYASSDGLDAVAGISISPNDEYMSIGVSPTYFTQTNGGTPASTLIVDTASGKVVDQLPSLEQVLWQ
jgi:hypothetical protein